MSKLSFSFVLLLLSLLSIVCADNVLDDVTNDVTGLLSGSPSDGGSGSSGGDDSGGDKWNRTWRKRDESDNDDNDDNDDSEDQDVQDKWLATWKRDDSKILEVDSGRVPVYKEKRLFDSVLQLVGEDSSDDDDDDDDDGGDDSQYKAGRLQPWRKRTPGPARIN